MADCQDAIYSEEYEDFIIEYAREGHIREDYGVDCYQLANGRFGVLYLQPSEITNSQRDMVLVTPRCFGLLSSTQTLEEAGIMRVRRQPRLELFGRQVLLGIVDTGAGVRQA